MCVIHEEIFKESAVQTTYNAGVMTWTHFLYYWPLWGEFRDQQWIMMILCLNKLLNKHLSCRFGAPCRLWVVSVMFICNVNTSMLHPNNDCCCLYIDGLAQERCNSIALAMELRLSCINPLIFWPKDVSPIWPGLPCTSSITYQGKGCT